MPTVPFVPKVPTAPQIDETFVAMAAADLHDAGMLFDLEQPQSSLASSRNPQPTEVSE
jgi:hypothetical protein